MQENQKYTGFEVYNVNNYDFFRNPLEARDLIIQALEIQPFPQSDVWDGELDGRMVKIMPVNRIATKADLEELKANLPYKTYEKRKADNPTQPVERITIVCMGHEPDLKASLEQGLSEYKLDIEIVDILPQLGVYVDEAHHLFGANLEKELRSGGANKTTLRNTINMLAASTSIVACYNYTGTPYVNKQVLPEVVYA